MGLDKRGDKRGDWRACQLVLAAMAVAIWCLGRQRLRYRVALAASLKRHI
jgi:hypothetical protein